jgi:hypothetical protein
MPQQPNKCNTIQNAELNAWLEQEDSDDVRELIVEAKIPPRIIRFPDERSGRRLPESMNSADKSEREAVLVELYRYLTELLGGSTNLLKSAGAVAVRANRQQLQAIARHPLVKAVRINRRLR